MYLVCRLNAGLTMCVLTSGTLQDMRQKIDAKLNKVQKIQFEPRLISPDDERLQYRGQSGESVSVCLSLALSLNVVLFQCVLC